MAVPLLRTLILYFAVIAAVRLMGKRQIGELDPSELVITILVSDLAAVPMQDLGIPMFAGLVPIATPMKLSKRCASKMYPPCPMSNMASSSRTARCL